MAWELSLWHLKWCSKDYLAFVFSFIGGWWHDKMAWKFFRTSWKQREIASYFVPFQLVRPKLGWEYPWVSKLKVQCQLNESFRYRMEFSNPSLHTLLFHHSNLILTHLDIIIHWHYLARENFPNKNLKRNFKNRIHCEYPTASFFGMRWNPLPLPLILSCHHPHYTDVTPTGCFDDKGKCSETSFDGSLNMV